MSSPRPHFPLLALAALLCAQAPSPAGRAGEACGATDDPACAAAPPASPAPPLAAPVARAPAATLTFYWGVGCPRCEEAQPFLDALSRERPGLVIRRVEVRRDSTGRAAYDAELARLGISPGGIPLFVVEDAYVLGFSTGHGETAIRALLEAPASAPSAFAPEALAVPLLGRVEARRVPLATLTAVVGLLDGLNPCAMWVLVVLLGLLVNVRARGRLLLFGGAFVLVSGLVYFAFMTAWSGLFASLGGSRGVTIALGVALVVMGLVNVKELFLLRRGPSLTIPDRAKPALYRRMRAVAGASTLPAALLGVIALALLANLVELGCTVGLPALYTRVLSLRPELAAWERIAWIAAYNVFYVVPLAVIVGTFAVVAPHAHLRERGARLLKGLSGILLLAGGVVLLLAPHLLA